MKFRITLALFAGLFGVTFPAAYAFDVRITIENLAPTQPTGLYLAPVWLGFHDGSFDLFNSGTAASPAIEQVAELGASGLLQASFSSLQPTGWQTVLNNPSGPGPGIYAPGTRNALTVSLDPLFNRYLSWAAMVVPSNDSFIANANPMLAQLFDGLGNFAGAQSWTILASQIWDAGTEVNDPDNGPAFLAGSDAMLGAAENGVIHAQTAQGLASFVGRTTAAGTILGQTITGDPFVRISIEPVPEPSTYGLMAAGVLLGLVGYRARRARRLN
jgi:hypothetical protein